MISKKSEGEVSPVSERKILLAQQGCIGDRSCEPVLVLLLPKVQEKMIDTHAHLNFAAFDKTYGQVIKDALKAGVTHIVIPSSNLETSQKAIQIAQDYPNVYATVGIHPFHVYGHLLFKKDLEKDFQELEKLLTNPKVVAIGELGLDRHTYKSQKYPDYQVSEELITLQKLTFQTQLKLAKKYHKSLIIHNRGAAEELLQILGKNWTKDFEKRAVFHFCEPDQKLLDFALKHNIFVGVDGDVTYDQAKQEFVKEIPLENLVLETDSPYIVPEPLKSKSSLINEPRNLIIISDFIARLTKTTIDNIQPQTTKNSLELFNLA